MAQEGRKVKPILPNTPSRFIDRKTSRTNLTSLKPEEDIFFSSFIPEFLIHFCPFFFFIPSSFHPLPFLFLLPGSFIYSIVLIFEKITSYLASDLSFFLRPSFLSFSIPLFPTSLLLFYFPISLCPTGETTKPVGQKRPELDPVTPINVSSIPQSTED